MAGISIGKLAAACSLSALMSVPVMGEVTVLGWPGGPEEVALRKVIEVYNAQPGVSENDKVEALFFNREGFWDKLQSDLAAGTKEFDINLTATYSLGRYAPYMEPITLTSNDAYDDKVLATMQYDGKQYGVPTDLSLHFMYYRTDLMDKLLSDPDWQAQYKAIAKEHFGKEMMPVSPEAWTWDDYTVTALFFAKKQNRQSPVRYGTVLQMKNLLFNMMIWHSAVKAYGGNWLNDSGEVTVDSNAFKNALTRYRNLYDAGSSPKDSLSYEYAEANAAFGAGQVATMLQWNAAAGDLTDATKNPTIAGKVGIAPPPSGPSGRFTHVHGLGFGLNKASENKEGALKFLNWLATADAAKAYALAGGNPALKQSVVADIVDQRPDLKTLGEYAGEYGFVMNGGTSKNALTVYEVQAREFTGYWAGQQSLDAALDNTEEAMQELLK
ncbi:sugar ABC transporter substrate-binding protein [Enterovibrio sp. ZSDZ35]|uniref:Sugar ABC transporter substrate-binding protein n=1 Tax=Enterovibrio qingdaonensis TaxID=2899818 RepID=A0ABT5QGX9_9GAMM|nr:sugar ABC transporter substrate-binding protein [Enterovibrio sp. ZSDZ35]MDD1779909.1 sugar ABC transporter substrate-binding protein [Enterovibrio sp. ZSDZ35]